MDQHLRPFRGGTIAVATEPRMIVQDPQQQRVDPLARAVSTGTDP
jgi:hypothetical protein